jgi:hypothetical protein
MVISQKVRHASVSAFIKNLEQRQQFVSLLKQAEEGINAPYQWLYEFMSAHNPELKFYSEEELSELRELMESLGLLAGGLATLVVSSGLSDDLPDDQFLDLMKDE